MAKMLCHKNFVIIASGDKINVYSDSTTFSLSIPDHVDTPKKTKHDTAATKTSRFLCMKFSEDGGFFGACNDRKVFAVWDATTLPWSLLNCRNVNRNCVSIHFTRNEKALIADKAGDVYECDVKSASSPSTPLMGHVSMLLDLTMSDDERYLVTCDRDEKIRVSCYPNAYNIKCFCMGHTQYVINCFLHPTMPDVLVSGSGDGTVRFWTFKTGDEISRICCTDYLTLKTERSPPEGTSNTRIPMKGLRFSAQLGLLATLFASSELVVFRIRTEGPRSVTWSHVQTLELRREPWDVAFHEDRFLLVLSPERDAALEAFRYSASTSSFQMQPSTARSGVEALAKSIGSDWDFLKSSLDLEEDYYTLYKQWYDNVKDYYERKEERTSKKHKNS